MEDEGSNSHKRPLKWDEARAALALRLARLADVDGEAVTPVRGLMLFRRSAPSVPLLTLSEPCVALIVQGRRRVLLGQDAYLNDESRYLLTSVDLPMVVQILDASRDRPYLSLLLRLDLDAARQLIPQLDARSPADSATARGIATAATTAELFDAFSRLLDLLDTPQDIPIIGDLIHREILYRLLTGEQGGRLRQIALVGSQSHQMVRVIAWLKENYMKPLRIEELAADAGIGVSTLHHHFRALTSISPLQYQKHLRLHEARRLMLVETLDACSAGLRVGYESPTQFNREYRRLFGAPPMRDIKGLRLTAHAAQRPTTPV